MNSSVKNGSLARAAASDVRENPRRIVRAGAILLVVPFAAAVCVFGLMFATMLVDPMHVDLLSWRAYRALTAFVAPVGMALALSVFAVLDALFVSTLLDEGGFSASIDQILENPRSVVPWILAFVVAFWPFRLVVLPQWTMAWLFEALAVMNGDLGWLPVSAIVRAIGAVVVLSAPTLYLAPLAVGDTRSSGRAFRDNFRIVREIPLETTMAALLGVGAVVVGFLVFGLSLLVLTFSFGFWLFSIFLAPFGIVIAMFGFVCLAATYAFARCLAVRTYRRGRNRLPNDSGAEPTNASADSS